MSDFSLGGVGVFPVVLGFVWGFGCGVFGISEGLTTLLPVVPPLSVGLGVWLLTFAGLVSWLFFSFIIIPFCVVVSVVVCGL